MPLPRPGPARIYTAIAEGLTPGVSTCYNGRMDHKHTAATPAVSHAPVSSQIEASAKHGFDRGREAALNKDPLALVMGLGVLALLTIGGAWVFLRLLRAAFRYVTR